MGDLFQGDPDNNIPSISWAQWSFADKNEASAALKPGACSSKSWSDTSVSGTFVKGYIQTHAQRVQGRAGSTSTTPGASTTTQPTKKVESTTKNLSSKDPTIAATTND